ncbi:hypothetical protein PTNB73_09412 [Pyrenophora teres f. teres]|nr:hypothetical protein PTNB73_09412 [Pyrenophora teres f. teres]
MSKHLPPVRACIFDVDGTLINSEDIYTDIYNNILREYGRPDYPWNVKATQQSRGSSGTKRLLDWAQVPLTPVEWAAKEKQGTHLFKNSSILPGVDDLLTTLKTKTSPRVLLSLASSAGHHKFALKTSHIPVINHAFDDPAFHIFGDDPEMSDSRKKPEPDIFLLALKRLNSAETARGERALSPEECLVFEDSIAGVEAARRAGMRVIWVPHPGLAEWQLLFLIITFGSPRNRIIVVLVNHPALTFRISDNCTTAELGNLGLEITGTKNRYKVVIVVVNHLALL